MTMGEAFFDEVWVIADDFDVEHDGNVDVGGSARRLPDFCGSGKGRMTSVGYREGDF